MCRGPRRPATLLRLEGFDGVGRASGAGAGRGARAASARRGSRRGGRLGRGPRRRHLRRARGRGLAGFGASRPTGRASGRGCAGGGRLRLGRRAGLGAGAGGFRPARGDGGHRPATRRWCAPSAAAQARWGMLHPEPAAVAALSAGLRARFDPRGVLNPGAWRAGGGLTAQSATATASSRRRRRRRRRGRGASRPSDRGARSSRSPDRAPGRGCEERARRRGRGRGSLTQTRFTGWVPEPEDRVHREHRRERARASAQKAGGPGRRQPGEQQPGTGPRPARRCRRG